ncbi:MAG: metallophosphatase [Rhizobiaceae bacterium MnEN-MB40S]|nr:MAG: metallophosphatase [Rhizobiaceae bacterium MnEN-MB40S]
MNRVTMAVEANLSETVRMTQIVISGTTAVCDPQGALWLPDSGVLVVSDLHLEKSAAFARRGMLLPPYDTALTLKLLASVIGRYRPGCVISLGDSFHDKEGAANLNDGDAEQLKDMMKGLDWYWIAGNHDPDRPSGLPGDCAEELYCDGLVFRHEPAADRADAIGEIAGHLHPAARVVRQGKGVRRACFAGDGERLVMPAFGVMTGGLSLKHPALNQLFDQQLLTAHLLGRDRVYSVPFSRLVA